MSLVDSLAGANDDGCVAAAAGAVQHLLRHASQQATLRALPRGAAALVGALRHASPTVRRRAAGAVANGSADGALCEALVAAGAVGSLLALLAAPAAAEERAAARALERLCVASAAARAELRAGEGAAAAVVARLRGSADAAVAPLGTALLSALGRTEARHFTAPRRPPKTWGGRSVVYYTGRTLEAWEPANLASGLGGSETAVVQLARRWAAAGIEVVVYLRLPAGRATVEWGGATFVDVSEFEPKDAFATLIVWRSLEVLDLPLRARTLLLDLHDMPIAGEMSAARLEKVDGVMVKSHFQHSALPPAARAARPPSRSRPPRSE